MYDGARIHGIMWCSKAGCIGLDEDACQKIIWRLCSLLDRFRNAPGKDNAEMRQVWDAHFAEVKAEIPESFRRSFVKAAVEGESKAASRGLITDIPVLMLSVPFFYFIFTEAGRRVLPRTPPHWLSSKWMLGFLILACLFGIGDVVGKIAQIRNAPKRARELEKLLL